GSGVDADPDGRPSVQADGDDTTGSNDEDGVQFLGPLYAGQPVTVSIVASTNGLLDAWIDYNGNGDWNDFDEQIFGSQPLLPGTNLFTLMVPPGALPGLRYARFRLSSVGNLFSDGPAPDGEVEDYAITIRAAIDLKVSGAFTPDPVLAGSDQTYTL